MKRSLILLLALGACVAPPKRVAPPVIAPRPAPLPSPASPPPVAAWEDRARTPGNWSYASDGATFAAETGAPILNLRCAASRDVVVTYSVAPSAAMTIRTTTLARALTLSAGGQARLTANDPLLDAMIFSRGRFMVSAAGQPDLIIPPWPELARVVEDCRG